MRKIKPYGQYLKERIKVFKQLKTDFVASRENRDLMVAHIRSLPVENGLLSEVALLQRQLNALLACKVIIVYFILLFTLFIKISVIYIYIY